MCKLKTFLSDYKLDIIFIAVIFTFTILFSNKFAVLHIKGDSMFPTYKNGNILMLKKYKDINNGDIIVFNSKESWGANENKFIKRVIAKEGDIVNVSKDIVTINDKIIKHHKQQCYNVQETSFTLKKDEYLVMGDNYPNSNDSLTQYCIGNQDFLVNKEDYVVHGKEFFLIGGIFN